MRNDSCPPISETGWGGDLVLTLRGSCPLALKKLDSPVLTQVDFVNLLKDTDWYSVLN